MIRLLITIASIWVAGLPGLAQTPVIKSGEHENFTRVVVPLPSGAGWKIEKSTKSFSVTFDAPAVLFDISQVFERIPRRRLLSIAQEKAGSKLTFLLACKCSVTSFVDNPEYLVIDIGNEEGTDTPRNTVPVIPFAQDAYRFSLPIVRGNSITANRRQTPMEIGEIIQPKENEVQGVLPPREPVTAVPTVSLSEERLLAQITRASKQGLLELVGSPGMETANAIQNVEPKPDLSQTRELPLFIKVETAIDRELADSTEVVSPLTTGNNCFDVRLIAIREWGSDEGYSTKIGKLRSRLYGEFDSIDSDVALEMARLNLYFGFAVEALQVIELSGVESRSSKILRELATILDSRSLPSTSLFAGQQMCESDVALWSILSADSLPEDVNDEAVSRAFLRLPPPLRSLLGPRVSNKYAEAGNSEMANSILRTTERVGEVGGSGSELAKASAAELKGDFELEKLELINSVKGGTEYSPVALVKLISNKYEARDSVAPDTPGLVAAYTTEFGGAEIGADLRRTLVVALALAGDFSEAFAELGVMKLRDGDNEVRSALAPLVTLLLENADDVTFLQYAIGLSSTSMENIDPSVGVKMARRLLDLGFVESAEMWLNTADESTKADGQRMMRAEIALARGLPRRALVELIGLKGPEADKVRATALWKSAEYQQVAQTLMENDDLDSAARGLWMADNWAVAPSQIDTRYGQVIERSARLLQNETGAERLPPLAKARSLMKDSSETRDAIKSLLYEVTLEEGFE